MVAHAVVSLLTDFGHRDPYVGVMKGVMAGIAPGATLIDITHEVGPQDVLWGAFALAAATPYFPPGTIHLAVVDPGVGTARAAVVVRTARATLVAPDNGLLTLALEHDPPLRAWRLQRPAFFLPTVSRTFHGRDVFAPVVGHLAAGRDPADMGDPVAPGELVRLAVPAPCLQGDGIDAAVLYIDRFGNLVTSLRPDDLRGGTIASVEVRDRRVDLRDSYQAVEAGDLLAIWGSFGYLEIARSMGSACEHLGCGTGEPIRVRVRPPT